MQLGSHLEEALEQLKALKERVGLQQREMGKAASS